MSKWIQKEVDKQLENIQDNKEENYNKIVERYFQKPYKKKPIKLWKILVPSTTALLIIVLSATIILDNIKKSPTEYFIDNEMVENATIEEIQQCSTSFELTFGNVTVNDNKRIYDSITKDTLRFSLRLSKGPASIDMLYITNERYKYQDDEELYDKNQIFQTIDIKYSVVYSSYKILINAYLEKEGQKIVIQYQQRSMDGSETLFWIFMNEFIAVK